MKELGNYIGMLGKRYIPGCRSAVFQNRGRGSRKRNQYYFDFHKRKENMDKRCLIQHVSQIINTFKFATSKASKQLFSPLIGCLITVNIKQGF